MGERELKVPAFYRQVEHIIPPRPWPDGDPPWDIYRLLDKSRLIRLVNVEIDYKQAVLKAQQDYYKAVSEIMKGMK